MPTESVVDRLRHLLGPEFEHITGTSIAGEVPVREALVNRMIAEHLAKTGGPVAAARVEAQGDDAFLAHVTLRLRIVPELKIPVRIEQQPDFPARPLLLLRWSFPVIGALATLAGPALAALETPPGVRLEGDRVIVDIRRVLELYRLEDLVSYVSALQIHTKPGAFVIRFAIDVRR